MKNNLVDKYFFFIFLFFGYSFFSPFMSSIIFSNFLIHLFPFIFFPIFIKMKKNPTDKYILLNLEKLMGINMRVQCTGSESTEI